MRRFVILILLLLVSSGWAGAAVPVPVESRLLEPTGRGIRPLDTIRILTRWDAAGYRISPDFRGLDLGAGGAAAIRDSLNGSYLIIYTTGPMEGLADSSGISIPITASIGDTAFTDTRLIVCRNVSAALPQHVSTVLAGTQTVYRPGDNLTIRSSWRTAGVRGFRLAADFRELVPSFREIDARVTPGTPDSAGIAMWQISYTIPPSGQLVPDGNNIALAVIGRDSLCSEVRHEGLTINLRRGGPPAPVEHRLVDPSSAYDPSDVRSTRYRAIGDADVGRVIRVYSRWDSSSYSVRADFSLLDGSTSPDVARPDTALGAYVIDHVVGSMAGRNDDSLVVPITATNRLGDTYLDRSFMIRRNRMTPPPTHLGTWIRDGKSRFRSNDSLIVYTRWQSPVGLKMEIIPAFQNLLPHFTPTDAAIVQRGVDTFMVVYRLPIRDPSHDPLVPDGKDIPLQIIARDRLWGMSAPETLRVDLDTTPPPAAPTFDPLVAETNVSRIHVTGTAPGAARVAIARAEGEQDLRFRYFVTPSDTAGHFETDIDLIPGRNKIGGWSEDDIGNRTTIGQSQIVRYIADRTTVYSTPYRPNEEITLEEAGGMREATIQIYNLEGERITEMDVKGPMLIARFHWNGTDAQGDRAQPGYYLMRVRRVLTDGKSRAEVLPLLFRND